MNRRTIDNIIVAVIGGLILLAAVVLFVAKADADELKIVSTYPIYQPMLYTTSNCNYMRPEVVS